MLSLALMLIFALSPAVASSSSEQDGEPAEPVLQTSSPDPSGPWLQVESPADAGWDEERLEHVSRLAKKAGSDAVLVVHRGRVVFAYGDITKKINAHSIRKPMLGALLGRYIESVSIDLDHTLEQLGIDDRQKLRSEEKSARIVDLLSGRSGVYHPAAYETAGKRAERPERGSHRPGEHFWSNNWGFNALLTIFEKQTGLRFFEQWEKELARPLGMQDFIASDGEYHYEREHSIHPAYPLRISTRDLARFGQLILQGGTWNDQQLVPESWVTKSLEAHTTFGPDGGYTGGFEPGAGFGWLWWIYPAASQPETRPALAQVDTVAAQGAGGQLLLLVPAHELVLVHRVDTDQGHRVRWDVLWAIADAIVAAHAHAP